MTYGYTIADAADRKVFDEASSFLVDQLHFSPRSETLINVDGSRKKEFGKDDTRVRLESDCDIDYVAILSERPLPISCLNKWTSD